MDVSLNGLRELALAERRGACPGRALFPHRRRPGTQWRTWSGRHAVTGITVTGMTAVTGATATGVTGPASTATRYGAAAMTGDEDPDLEELLEATAGALPDLVAVSVRRRDVGRGPAAHAVLNHVVDGGDVDLRHPGATRGRGHRG